MKRMLGASNIPGVALPVAAPQAARDELEAVPAGGGETGALIRSMDWAATPLGPRQTWPLSLRTVVRLLLASRFPMVIWWGPQFVQLYNDAYLSIVGAKHPRSLGQPAHECWSEIWDVVGPLAQVPYSGGPATWLEDLTLEINRYGKLEEAHFTTSHSALPDDAPGSIGGLLLTVHETTLKVVAERRVAILSELGARAAQGRTPFETCRLAAEVLERHRNDLPFALLYLADAAGTSLVLAGSAGVAADAPVSPPAIELEGGASGWPVRDVLAEQTARKVDDLPARFASLPSGPWSDPPHTAVVLALKSSVPHRPAGVLIAGVSSRLSLDESYSRFLELAAAQIATAVANARAYDEERKRAEALAKVDRAKTAFFSNVSHEFRTPLTLMLGPIQTLLADSSIGGIVRERLDLVHRNSLRLLKLVNSLLDFSRLEAGRMQASYEPTDLSTLTAHIASTFRSAIERAGMRFEVELECFEPVYVDREMWEKIVLNLLSNAFKFTLQGFITVLLYSDGDACVLEVIDTGTGIPEKELPHVFERFHRVEGTRGRAHEGSGIGLALVRELVELHGGRIEAESVVGKGSTFRVRVPRGAAHLPRDRVKARRRTPTERAEPDAAEAFVQEALRWLPAPDGEPARHGEPERHGKVERHGGQAARPRWGEPEATHGAPEPPGPLLDRRFAQTFGARIVLADDNADMRAYVRGLLEPFYAVELAADGVEALAAARREWPDLIVSDVMMPRMDGFELLRTLRGDPSLRAVPVILLSARAGDESRVEGLDVGADDYLVKPFFGRELLARVGALLERERMHKIAIEQLALADRQKNEFLAMLAHELRNPLAPARNAAELVARTLPQDSKASDAVDIMQRQVAHLTRLVDDLLDVSRITQGRIELKRRPTHLANAVADAVESVEPLLRERGHQVTVVADHEPLRIDGDPERLVQCIANILTNAAKYTDPGGRIRVETRREGDEAVIEVSDNGVGIAPELLPRVFDLFVQSQRTLDRSDGGLGVGLSVVKRLIEMHDGSVVAMSAGLGRGTTFTIRLPLLARPGPACETAEPPAPAPRRILLVDDNKDAAKALTLLLRLDGHEVWPVHTPHDALEQAQTFAPDVVLLDIGLPDIDGYEVARRLRAQPGGGELRVVALTGYGRAEGEALDHATGFDDYLTKPVDLATLRIALAAA